jgi:enterochelin esterase-like enzyme
LDESVIEFTLVVALSGLQNFPNEFSEIGEHSIHFVKKSEKSNETSNKTERYRAKQPAMGAKQSTTEQCEDDTSGPNNQQFDQSHTNFIVI